MNSLRPEKGNARRQPLYGIANRVMSFSKACSWCARTAIRRLLKQSTNCRFRAPGPPCLCGSSAGFSQRAFQNRTRKNCRGPISGAVYGLTAFGTVTQRPPRSVVVSRVAVLGYERIRLFGPRTNWTRVSQSTVTENEQELDWPARLVATLVTMVVPLGKKLPDGGVDTTGTLGS